MATDEPEWFVDDNDPEHPFGWTDAGDIFAVYRRRGQWYPITTRRRLWWERGVKTTVGAILVLAALVAWAASVGALRQHHHVFYATVLGVGPLLWGCGYAYGKR